MKACMGQFQQQQGYPWTPTRAELPPAVAVPIVLAALGNHQLGRFSDDIAETLTRSVEADGYAVHDGQLHPLEPDAPNVKEEQNVIVRLFRALRLPENPALHHLRESEERYVEGNWDDAISQSRKMFEASLKEIASALWIKRGSTPPDPTQGQPVAVRNYLEQAGLLEREEKRAIDGAYGLLSHTGAHPHIARQDQARLLRHVAVIYVQFVLLQWQQRAKLP